MLSAHIAPHPGSSVARLKTNHFLHHKHPAPVEEKNQAEHLEMTDELTDI